MCGVGVCMCGVGVCMCGVGVWVSELVQQHLIRSTAVYMHYIIVRHCFGGVYGI